MDRGAWQATVHGIRESDMTEHPSVHVHAHTHTHTHTHTYTAAPSNRLLKEMGELGGGLKTDIFISCVVGWMFLANILKFFV